MITCRYYPLSSQSLHGITCAIPYIHQVFYHDAEHLSLKLPIEFPDPLPNVLRLNQFHAPMQGMYIDIMDL